MITDSLSHTLRLIEQYHKDYPTAYACIDTELNCLKEHIKLVIKYVAPLSVDDMNITLLKKVEEVRQS